MCIPVVHTAVQPAASALTVNCRSPIGRGNLLAGPKTAMQVGLHSGHAGSYPESLGGVQNAEPLSVARSRQPSHQLYASGAILARTQDAVRVPDDARWNYENGSGKHDSNDRSAM
jgi:hypothetical protein